MSPLPQFWERGFRSLMWRLRPTSLQAAIESARALIESEAATLNSADAAKAVYERMRQQVVERLLLIRFGPVEPAWTRARLKRREQFAQILDRSIPATPIADDPDFHCDSGLGGLARWLRAMGYDARFWPDIDDHDLLRTVIGSTAILLTTDSRLMQHAAIDRGAVAALLVPIGQNKRGQLEFVASKLELPRLPARCMACGGALVPVEKEAVRERIPPRTYPWRDEYFLCARCNRLYWEGSHWERIRSQLARVARSPRASC